MGGALLSFLLAFAGEEALLAPSLGFAMALKGIILIPFNLLTLINNRL